MNAVGRKKRFLMNSGASALSELVSMICGLIIPRLILTHYGSDYNGIISSITQIISFVTLLRSGVGGVTRAALYKPLAEGDNLKISAIVKATEAFMRKIAFIFVGAILVLAAVYPLFVTDFEWVFTFAMVLVLSISTFVQYYYGITYQMLLMADQRQYVFTFFNIASVILNAVISVILINTGCSILIVKLGSAIAFAMTPVFMHIYVRRHYRLTRDVPADSMALKQRWDALGQQIAYYVLTSTDLTVLTLMADIRLVSVYSVYHLPVKAVKMIIKTYASSVEAAFGNIMAKNQRDTLLRSVRTFECFMYGSSTFLFACLLGLIIPFVRIYTAGVTDVNYYHPLFAVLITLGELIYCLRIPYTSLADSAGKFRETKRGAYLEAALNVSISVVLCLLMDPLLAVSIGTLVSLLFRTIELSAFVNKHLLDRKGGTFYRYLIESVIVVCVTYFISTRVPIYATCTNYMQWLLLALVNAVIAGGLIVVSLALLDRKAVRDLRGMLKHMVKKG